jgi:hypothetical protein
MRCIYTHAGTGRKQEMHLSAALQPETACYTDDQSQANRAAIGALVALLVHKGAITLDEAINACGIRGEIEMQAEAAKKEQEHE